MRSMDCGVEFQAYSRR